MIGPRLVHAVDSGLHDAQIWFRETAILLIWNLNRSRHTLDEEASLKLQEIEAVFKSVRAENKMGSARWVCFRMSFLVCASACAVMPCAEIDRDR